MVSARTSKGFMSVGEGESERHAVPFIDQASRHLYAKMYPVSQTSHRTQAQFPTWRGGGRVKHGGHRGTQSRKLGS